jgi:hypothetical protein
MLEILAVAVGVLILVVLVLLVIWLFRPSRKRALVILGPALVLLIVVLLAVLALPKYKLALPSGNRVVATESTGLKIGIHNAGFVAGNYSAAYALDGLKQSDVVVRVGGRSTAEVSVPLPSDLAPGSHTVAIGDVSFSITALRPAAFQVTQMEPSIKMAKTGQKVTVSGAVMNTGEAPGEFDGVLYADGRNYDAQPTTLAPGAQQSLSFTFTSNSQGKHSLRLGDATLSLVVVRPIHFPNGHYLRRTVSGGRGTLTITNGNSNDGVVVVTRTSARNVPVIACWVEARHKWTVTGIPDGSYWVYYTVGRDWNTYTDGFLTTTRRARFHTPMRFSTSTWTTSWSTYAYNYTQGHVQWSVWRITLNPVAGGTARTDDVGEGGFPRVP